MMMMMMMMMIIVSGIWQSLVFRFGRNRHKEFRFWVFGPLGPGAPGTRGRAHQPTLAQRTAFRGTGERAHQPTLGLRGRGRKGVGSSTDPGPSGGPPGKGSLNDPGSSHGREGGVRGGEGGRARYH